MSDIFDRSSACGTRAISNVLRSDIDGMAYFLHPKTGVLMAAPMAKGGFDFDPDEAEECYATEECPQSLITGLTLALQLLEESR